jgi:hypothetical protein
LKLVCNVNNVYGNLKSENSEDYGQKPQRNFTFKNSTSDLCISASFPPVTKPAIRFQTCLPCGASQHVNLNNYTANFLPNLLSLCHCCCGPNCTLKVLSLKSCHRVDNISPMVVSSTSGNMLSILWQCV